MTAASPLRDYTIRSEPRGTAFEALLAYCAATGSYCSLVDRFPRSKRGREASAQFFQGAEPYLLGIDEVERWPGDGPYKGHAPHWKYRLEPGLLALLRARATGLYGFQGPRLPEDLAVHRADGSVLLGSVAHEHTSWMTLSAGEKDDPRLGLVELRLQGH